MENKYIKTKNCIVCEKLMLLKQGLCCSTKCKKQYFNYNWNDTKKKYRAEITATEQKLIDEHRKEKDEQHLK